MPQPTSGPSHQLAASYQVTDEILNEFKQLVMQSPLRFDEAAWQKDEEFFRAMIRKEIDTDLFGLAVAYKNLAARDPQLKYSVTLFPEAQQLLEMSKTTSTRVQR